MLPLVTDLPRGTAPLRLQSRTAPLWHRLLPRAGAPPHDLSEIRVCPDLSRTIRTEPAAGVHRRTVVVVFPSTRALARVGGLPVFLRSALRRSRAAFSAGEAHRL